VRVPEAARAGFGGVVGRVSIALFLLLTAGLATGQESVCSVVRIQIQQELTLERQAFDAHMRITNGLDTSSLENIEINVWFHDADGIPVLASSDPDNTSALFFITLDSMSGITGIDGGGSIAPGAQADIYWLIIPAPGAGGSDTLGELYEVGATLSYSLGGEHETIEVAPDFIQVRPMPRLTLDYFLPAEVIGDDPLVSGQQDPIPFPLAVRVTNSGHGPASNLAIESAQPQIVENHQGLPIHFELLNTRVNDGEVINSLMAEFGDLGAGESATAVWQMVVSLYGHFIAFEASYYHSDTLGGELTSLIDSVNTHTLVQVVRNDLPGRDNRRDFLARNGSSLRLYESEGIDTDVTERSGQSTLVFLEAQEGLVRYEWQFPETAGPVYAELTDPTGGEGVLQAVWRSDGKMIDSVNFGQRPSKESGAWEHLVHLFDTNSGGRYEAVFALESSVNQPPVLDFVDDRTIMVEQQLAVDFSASDPDEDILSFELTPVPAGASFTDFGNGNARLDWTPTEDDIGEHQLLISVSDGQASDSQQFAIHVEEMPSEPVLLVEADLPLTTSEDGGEATFRVRLSAQPTATVEVPIASSDPSEGVVSPELVILTPDNWDQQHEVTVTGVDDDWLDGDIDYEIQIGPTSSTDSDFDGLTHDALPAVNLDSDTAGIVVDPASGLATAGAHSGAELSVALTAAPLAPVTLAVASSRSEWGEPVPESVVLDQDNWQHGEVVRIEGRDDDSTPVGTHAYEVTVSVDEGDPDWHAADQATVELTHRAGDTWAIAAGTIELPQVDGESGFHSLEFDYPFDDTPVVVVLGDDGEPAPASVRLRAIDRFGFEIVQVQPPTEFSLSAPTRAHFLAVEQGRHSLPNGGSIEAGVSDVSAVVDSNSATGWHGAEFHAPFVQAPVLLTSLQTQNNESANLPQSASSPWLTVAVRQVDQSGFDAALERSGVLQGDITQSEQVGWIAWQGASGGFGSDQGQVAWQAQATAIEAAPWSLGCDAASSIAPTGDTAIIVAGKHSRTSAGGGWLRLCATGSGQYGLLVDQDTEQNDNRGEDSEQTGLVMFSQAFHTRLPAVLDRLFRDAFEEVE
jgi:hypothetical protein